MRAVDDGTIAKLFTSEAGGLTIYQFDPTRDLLRTTTLTSTATPQGCAKASRCRRGQLLGYVGSTGNASARRAASALRDFRLDRITPWWKGDPINPYPLLTK